MSVSSKAESSAKTLTGEKEGDGRRAYLDNNATTQYAPEVREAIVSAINDSWANPSCSYEEGRRAREVVDDARAKVARSIGCHDPAEIVFTSGGTEANNWVVRCLELEHDTTGDEVNVVTTAIEHPSVALAIDDLCRRRANFTCTRVMPDARTGAVRSDDVVAALAPSTRLVSVMLANNETGVLQPVGDVAAAVRSWAASRGLPRPALHTDAAQALGKVPVDVGVLGVDFLTVAGHKFYGPRIGALFAARESPLPLRPVLLGGGQERGVRSGTENTAMVAGLGRACQLVTDDGESAAARRMAVSCDRLRRGLTRALGGDGGAGVRFNCSGEGAVGAAAAVLPNTCSVALMCLPFSCSGRDVLARCRHVVAGVGSACHSTTAATGNGGGGGGGGDDALCGSVLTRSGVSADAASRTLRLSTGRYTSDEDVDLAVEDIAFAVFQLSAAT